MIKVCNTCTFFMVPITWKGLSWNGTETQVGICEIPTPRIPKVIDFKRNMTVGSQWIDCPCWTGKDSKE